MRSMNGVVECTNVNCLVLSLASKDMKRRVGARRALVAMGKPAVRPLVEALSDRSTRMRWEAAKALTGIPDPAAAPALAGRLMDRDFGVRWLAAEALCGLGRDAMAAVLKVLSGNPRSREVREGAHHVLGSMRDLAPALLCPVLEALEAFDWDQVVPAAAKTALKTFRNAGSPSPIRPGQARMAVRPRPMCMACSLPTAGVFFMKRGHPASQIST